MSYKVTPELEARRLRAWELAQEGKTYREIAAETGFYYGSISVILRRFEPDRQPGELSIRQRVQLANARAVRSEKRTAAQMANMERGREILHTKGKYKDNLAGKPDLGGNPTKASQYEGGDCDTPKCACGGRLSFVTYDGHAYESCRSCGLEQRIQPKGKRLHDQRERLEKFWSTEEERSRVGNAYRLLGKGQKMRPLNGLRRAG